NVRRLSLLVISVGLLSVACAEINPAAPSSVPRNEALDAKPAKPGKPANVDGTVGQLVGTPDAFSFVVGTTAVQGDSATEFFGQSVFAHLANGVRVEVQGERRSDHVYARRMHVNSRVIQPPPDAGTPPPPPPPPPCSWPAEGPTAGEPAPSTINIEIVIGSIAGGSPDLDIQGGGRLFHTNSTTIVKRLDDLLPLDILRTNLVVRMFGTQRPDVSVDVTEIQITRNTLDVDADGEAADVTGGYPEARFTIGTTTFLANDWTRFSGSPCDALVNGTRLKVRGVRMVDGVTVLATFVEIVP
ncbi:MAG TPA: DUF5666 domain-containing protein, partial [Vicinamibacterales bacterium]|nr:DUF5666 domain-containing protein [Vicinamibacterales bacterium]